MKLYGLKSKGVKGGEDLGLKLVVPKLVVEEAD